MHRNKMIVGMLISLLGITVLAPVALAATETFHETYNVKPETRLTVSNKNGGITIRAWENETVDVVAEKKTNLGGKLEDVEIAVTVGERMTIETVHLVKNPRVSVSYTISVPSSMIIEQVQSSNGAMTLQGANGDVIAKTSNGAIKIVEHTGNVSVETSNGGIELQQINGSVKAETSNGAIKITGVTGITGVKTSNGSIHAEIMEIAEESLELKTSNGSIKIFLASDLNADVEMNTSNGKISIQDIEIVTTEISKTSFEGRIGDGGKKLEVKTSNGTIEVYGLRK